MVKNNIAVASVSDSQTRNSAIQQMEQFEIKWFQFLLVDTANGPKSVKWQILIL